MAAPANPAAAAIPPAIQHTYDQAIEQTVPRILQPFANDTPRILGLVRHSVHFPTPAVQAAQTLNMRIAIGEIFDALCEEHGMDRDEFTAVEVVVVHVCMPHTTPIDSYAAGPNGPREVWYDMVNYHFFFMQSSAGWCTIGDWPRTIAGGTIAGDPRIRAAFTGDIGVVNPARHGYGVFPGRVWLVVLNAILHNVNPALLGNALAAQEGNNADDDPDAVGNIAGDNGNGWDDANGQDWD